LVFDGDGCYDPADFNDSLVLGMKGTFAQAELHIIRARLHGGKPKAAYSSTRMAAKSRVGGTAVPNSRAVGTLMAS
jgi:DNA invertase Pin-like site-specific DNA recombinase